MGQEFFVKSDTLEDKVRELLPSQGGLGQGFDLSASTQIIPIVDLTESAEGSNVRPDLQSALSFNDVTAFSVSNTTSTVINTTGYYRVFGTFSGKNSGGGATRAFIQFNDGVSDKVIYEYVFRTSPDVQVVDNFDFVVFLSAGQFLKIGTDATNLSMIGCTKQLASIDGTLTTPS
mgnify:CR=1 FL=1|jgi:hypothetical protein